MRGTARGCGSRPGWWRSTRWTLRASRSTSTVGNTRCFHPLASSSRARAPGSTPWAPGRSQGPAAAAHAPLRAGWSSKHDEWLAASSLEPPGSRTSPAQLAQQSLAQQKNEAEEKAKRKAEREAARTPPQNVVMQCVAPQRGRNRDGRVIQLGSVRHTLAPRFGQDFTRAGDPMAGADPYVLGAVPEAGRR